MRGQDHQQADMFSYVSPEARVRADHPLRAIRAMADAALAKMSPLFDAMYASTGRPSIPPEKLLRAQLIQMLYSVGSERLLMEEIDYSALFRWFVGMNLDEPVWDPTVFTKNRERLLEGDVARAFLAEVVSQAQEEGLMSDEHFTVDGTLIEAWASLKSFQRKDEKEAPPPDAPGNPTVNFQGEKRSNETHASTTDPDAKLAQRRRQGSQAQLQRQSAGGEPQRPDRKRRGVRGQRPGRARCGAGDVGAAAGHAAGDGGSRQGLRHGGLRGGMPGAQGDAACGAEPEPAWRKRPGWADDAARQLCRQPAEEEAD